jgi:hypothetical protein
MTTRVHGHVRAACMCHAFTQRVAQCACCQGWLAKRY